MPLISIINGIKIYMYYNDHTPIHFHVEYNGNKGIIELDTMSIIKGYIPKKQLNIVLGWANKNREILYKNWQLARDGEPLIKIK